MTSSNIRADQEILQWRTRAFGIVLWAGLALGAVPLGMVLFGSPHGLPTGALVGTLVIYALVAVVGLARRCEYVTRGWLWLLLGFSMAGLMLATAGLEGAGRLLLVVLPLYATVLLGVGEGYAAAGLSLALYAAVAIVDTRGLLDAIPHARTGVSHGGDWGLQGLTLVFVLAPIMVLVNHFVGLLQRTLASERAATARISEANAERRRLERVLLETGERERREVGHQLHDGPCQQLTAALLRCRVAQNSLAAGSATGQSAHLEAVSGMLEASVGEIHDLARGLAPPDLAPRALPAALADLARGMAVGGRVTCEFRHDGRTAPADQETSSQLYRVAQEAVSNALRHAQAARIEIELAGDGASLRLTVRDDGIGVSADSAGQGMGLRIMRHRADLIGGSLTVGPAPGWSTVVTCTVPFGATGEAGA